MNKVLVVKGLVYDEEELLQMYIRALIQKLPTKVEVNEDTVKFTDIPECYLPTLAKFMGHLTETINGNVTYEFKDKYSVNFVAGSSFWLKNFKFDIDKMTVKFYQPYLKERKVKKVGNQYKFTFEKQEYAFELIEG